MRCFLAGGLGSQERRDCEEALAGASVTETTLEAHRGKSVLAYSSSSPSTPDSSCRQISRCASPACVHMLLHHSATPSNKIVAYFLSPARPPARCTEAALCWSFAPIKACAVQPLCPVHRRPPSAGVRGERR